MGRFVTAEAKYNLYLFVRSQICYNGSIISLAHTVTGQSKMRDRRIGWESREAAARFYCNMWETENKGGEDEENIVKAQWGSAGRGEENRV